MCSIVGTADAMSSGGVMTSNHPYGSHPTSTVVSAARGPYFRVVVAIAAVAFCLSASLYAKVAAGISGIVTDASGAVVSGATIKVTDTDNGVVSSRQSNADGFYAFVDLQPGHYDVEVQQAGFTTFHQTGVVLDVDSAKVMNIKMVVGQVSAKVEVTANRLRVD